MPGGLTAQELVGAALRAQNPATKARWWSRAFLELRFTEHLLGQVRIAISLTQLVARGRHVDAATVFAALTVDGLLGATARDPRAQAQLVRAAELFQSADLRHDPLWVELMSHVAMAAGLEHQILDLVSTVMGKPETGAADRQRLECVLGMAELRLGHRVYAAAALQEASLPMGMVDERRRVWAIHLQAQLEQSPAQRGQTDLEPVSTDELRVLAATVEGLTSGQIAHRLALSVRSVEFYRRELRAKLGPRHRSA